MHTYVQLEGSTVVSKTRCISRNGTSGVKGSPSIAQRSATYGWVPVMMASNDVIMESGCRAVVLLRKLCGVRVDLDVFM